MGDLRPWFAADRSESAADVKTTITVRSARAHLTMLGFREGCDALRSYSIKARERSGDCCQLVEVPADVSDVAMRHDGADSTVSQDAKCRLCRGARRIERGCQRLSGNGLET